MATKFQSKRTIKRNLKELRGVIDAANKASDSTTARIAYAMEMAARWVAEDTDWGADFLAKEAINEAGILRDELNRRTP